MKVKDAMHKSAEWVTPETTVAQLARKMKDLDIGRTPSRRERPIDWNGNR